MTGGRFESELALVKRIADELAQKQKERASSAHLLAAIAARPSPASDLLRERKLGVEELLRAARGVEEELDEPLKACLQRAREIAGRMGDGDAAAVHLLVALVGEPRSSARRVLEGLNVDTSRLRTQAVQVGLGLVGRRRASPEQAREVPLPPPRRVSKAIKVPLYPPPRKSMSGEASSQAPSSAATPEARGAGVIVPVMALPSGAPKKRAAATRSVQLVPLLEKPVHKEPEPWERFELDPQKFPTLTTLGRNLTLAAARGELDPVVGRDAVIEQALDVLAKREGNNPCLVGIAGVGKTSIVRGLAQRIAAAEDVLSLDDRVIVQIPVSELVAGTGVRGALASRIGALRKEVLAAKGRVVIFFDEIHQLFTGEAAEEVASELKIAFSRGELPCIGATTPEDFQKALAADAGLARRFSLVEVEQPSREEAYLIVDALKPRLEAHHRVRYQTEALALGVGWSVRYLPGRALPDKAVSILDLAGARTRRRGKPEVTAESVAEVVAELADMPVDRLLEADGERMLRLEEILAERVVGHGDQIRRIARILRRNAAGLGSRRPIGTFLLLGPTGVGKTESAKAIAEVLFHCDTAMTRVDLSEFSEPHAIARLIGAPPGYVGHEAGGQLTEAVRRRPYQVILLDELEKAHPDVLTSFLGVFDEGRLTDGRGRTVDFTNTVILMTSNLGAEESGSTPRRRVGFGNEVQERADLEQRVVAAARSALAPELYNRIDEVLVFAPLARDEVREIARRLLEGVSRALSAQRGLRLDFGQDVVEFLLDHGGFEPTLGARPMKRTIARLVEAPLAEKILRGELHPKSTLLLSVEGDHLEVDVLDGTAHSAAE
ncbi:MAG TPA: ATP-dependent Clp protease ATP-binding subunit [Polyangiaceae bacterium]|nr:ATP-dependent Clp protease ATP-binding subunit [Polyangiaceae bacterium]